MIHLLQFFDYMQANPFAAYGLVITVLLVFTVYQFGRES